MVRSCVSLLNPRSISPCMCSVVVRAQGKVKEGTLRKKEGPRSCSSWGPSALTQATRETGAMGFERPQEIAAMLLKQTTSETEHCQALAATRLHVWGKGVGAGTSTAVLPPLSSSPRWRIPLPSPSHWCSLPEARTWVLSADISCSLKILTENSVTDETRSDMLHKKRNSAQCYSDH